MTYNEISNERKHHVQAAHAPGPDRTNRRTVVAGACSQVPDHEVTPGRTQSHEPYMGSGFCLAWNTKHIMRSLLKG